MPEVVQLFPTPVYRNNLGPPGDLLPLKFNTLMYDLNVNYKRTHLDNGLITEDQEYLLQDSTLKGLIDNEIEIYLRDALRLKKTVYLKHQSSWVLLHKKGDFSPKSYHSNSWLSGIYYHTVNEDNGSFKVLDKPPFSWTCSSMNPESEVEEFNFINGMSYTFSPEPGDIYLFPSHVTHLSLPNESDDDRVCVVFNYTLHGTWGKSTERITI